MPLAALGVAAPRTMSEHHLQGEVERGQRIAVTASARGPIAETDRQINDSMCTEISKDPAEVRKRWSERIESPAFLRAGAYRSSLRAISTAQDRALPRSDKTSPKASGSICHITSAPIAARTILPRFNASRT
ncbi:hypothetical protein [Methylorubrum thiocyanatum]|uniref:hypothetical protein n=1 Tax=Methylorubrum thiocyanatum TaxID=47958 RepID=UPI00398C6E54